MSEDHPTPPDHELGGDPACWLNRVCPECGLFLDDPAVARCPRCDASIPHDEPEPR